MREIRFHPFQVNCRLVAVEQCFQTLIGIFSSFYWFILCGALGRYATRNSLPNHLDFCFQWKRRRAPRYWHPHRSKKNWGEIVVHTIPVDDLVGSGFENIICQIVR